MRGEIPSALGLLMLVGCSDAAAVANALEKVCKSDCDCESATGISDWNDVEHCKQACEGYATILQALIEDVPGDEKPCADLHQILGDIKDCTKTQCITNACIASAYDRLYACWPAVFEYYYGYTSSTNEAVSGADLVHQLMAPIPGAIPAQLLHAATPD